MEKVIEHFMNEIEKDLDKCLGHSLALLGSFHHLPDKPSQETLKKLNIINNATSRIDEKLTRIRLVHRNMCGISNKFTGKGKFRYDKINNQWLLR